METDRLTLLQLMLVLLVSRRLQILMMLGLVPKITLAAVAGDVY